MPVSQLFPKPPFTCLKHSTPSQGAPAHHQLPKSRVPHHITGIAKPRAQTLTSKRIFPTLSRTPYSSALKLSHKHSQRGFLAKSQSTVRRPCVSLSELQMAGRIESGACGVCMRSDCPGEVMDSWVYGGVRGGDRRAAAVLFGFRGLWSSSCVGCRSTPP